MMRRRDFLGRTGALLVAWGLSDSAIAQHRQVLAAPTPRKLALLIGINQYHDQPLSGCVTDVELQRELLIHRFGFQSSDILTLVDQQATSGAIVEAMTNHLIAQAQAGDVVVIHFSGYGGLTYLPTDRVSQEGGSQDSRSPSQPRPSRSLIPAEDTSTQSADILEDTWELWVRSLATDRVTRVIDASSAYAGQSLQGNLWLRSRPRLTVDPIASDAFEQRERLLAEQHLTALTLETQPHSTVSLLAAGPGQGALETRSPTFSAGVFTHLLTQHLWQTTEPLRSLFRIVQPPLMQAGDRAPQLLPPERSPLPVYFVSDAAPPADGAITAVGTDGKTADVWLGGLSPDELENCLASLWQVEDGSLVQVVSRDGMTARVKGVSLRSPGRSPSLKVGQCVREQVRVLPRAMGLTVAVDGSMGRIERVDAISALSALSRVTAVAAGEQRVDSVFSRLSPPDGTQVAALPNVPIADLATSRYGLFSSGLARMPNTLGDGGEAIKLAVRRLEPKFQSVLAAKLLRSTINLSASALPVQVTLEQMTDLSRSPVTTIAQQHTRTMTASPVTLTNLAQLAIGNRIQYRIATQASEPLYFLVLNWDNAGNWTAFYYPSPEPGQFPTVSSDNVVTLPPSTGMFQWNVRSPVGMAETFVICSRSPLTQTMAVLETMGRPNGEIPVLYGLRQPLDVAQAVWEDLHQMSRDRTAILSLPTDSVALAMDQWVTIAFVYQVVG